MEPRSEVRKCLNATATALEVGGTTGTREET